MFTPEVKANTLKALHEIEIVRRRYNGLDSSPQDKPQDKGSPDSSAGQVLFLHRVPKVRRVVLRRNT